MALIDVRIVESNSDRLMMESSLAWFKWISLSWALLESDKVFSFLSMLARVSLKSGWGLLISVWILEANDSDFTS